MHPNHRPSRCLLHSLLILCSLGGGLAQANTTPQTLPFSQDWSNTALLSAADDWLQVPGIVGFRGDNLTTATAVDAQTVLADDTPGTIDLIPNVNVPDTNTGGGVAELEVSNPAVALQGSGTADAPYLQIYLDTTGAQSIRVQYKVRDMDGSADNAVQQLALHYRVGDTGTFTNVPAAYVADGTTGGTATQETAISVLLPAAVDNQPLVQLRLLTTNAVGNDEWIGIDDISIVIDNAPVLPALSIANLALAEGNTPNCSTTNFDFTVTSSLAAPMGGINFTFDTADGSASAGSDYTAVVGGAGQIAEGQTQGTATVVVNCDVDPEASETFTVSLVDGVDYDLGSPSSATGTINNDDGIIQREIAEIQGTGFQSPFNNTEAAVSGVVVTALVNNGFFIQDPTPDTDPASSDAMFVFTSTLPTVAVGDLIDVSGTIVEAAVSTPAGTPNYSNITKFTNSGLLITVHSTGNGLPAPLALDDVMPSPLPALPFCTAMGGSFTPADFISTQNFECLEAMRVSLATGVTNAPMQSFASDPFAEINITSSGQRAFREAGMTPAGAAENLGLISLTPPAPPLASVVWDNNPEVFEIDQDRLVDGSGTPLLANPMLVPGSDFSATGVLGFEFGGYELFPDSIDVFAPAPPIPGTVPAATVDQLTLGSLNMLRLYDRCDDPARPNGDEVVDLPRVTTKLDKLSRYVREVLQSPDLIAVQEAEQESPPGTVCANAEPNTSALQLLADQITTDGGPQYTPVIAPFTNDIGWINVGFLVRADRVQVDATQHLQATDTWVFNGTTQSRLHDRPSFLLEATALFASPPFAFTVIDNHLRSLSGIDDLSPVADQENAHRVRQKRLRQAVGIACEAQAYQASHPGRALVMVGDFNAFQFSDGYADTLGIVRGDTDPAASEYDIDFIPLAERCDNSFAGQIVSPALTEAVLSLPEDERYSFYFTGVPQELDHALLSTDALQRFERIAYGRGNADARNSEETVPGSALRSSDHDGFVVYLNAGSAPTNNGFVLFADGLE